MTRKKRDTILEYGILSVLAVIFLIPLSWVVLASFDRTANMSAKLPDFTLSNYVSVLTNTSDLRALGNGLIISLGATILTVFLAILMAYPLSRFEMKYKRVFMLTLLFMTALPATTVMVPVYRMFVVLGLYDNILGLIVFMSAGSLPYAIWMMKNFMDSVSISLEEAAWVDGAGRFSGLFRVVFPLMLPGISSVGIFVFSSCWGNFQTPYILLNTMSKMPASVTLYRFFGDHIVSYGALASFSILYAIPSIILYVLSQRYMSQGFIMEGGTKE